MGNERLLAYNVEISKEPEQTAGSFLALGSPWKNWLTGKHSNPETESRLTQDMRVRIPFTHLCCLKWWDAAVFGFSLTSRPSSPLLYCSTSGAQLPTGVSPLLLSMTWRNLQRLSVGGWLSPSVAILWHSWDLPTRYNPETGFCLRAMWQTKSLSSFREDDWSTTRWVSGHLRSSARTSSWKGQCSSHCCSHRSRQHE